MRDECGVGVCAAQGDQSLSPCVIESLPQRHHATLLAPWPRTCSIDISLVASMSKRFIKNMVTNWLSAPAFTQGVKTLNLAQMFVTVEITYPGGVSVMKLQFFHNT